MRYVCEVLGELGWGVGYHNVAGVCPFFFKTLKLGMECFFGAGIFLGRRFSGQGSVNLLR